jgi:hypothetical protein
MTFTFTDDDLIVADQARTLNQLRYERPPRELWARVCVEQLHRQLISERQFLTPPQGIVLIGLDIWDQTPV